MKKFYVHREKGECELITADSREWIENIEFKGFTPSEISRAIESDFARISAGIDSTEISDNGEDARILFVGDSITELISRAIPIAEKLENELGSLKTESEKSEKKYYEKEREQQEFYREKAELDRKIRSGEISIENAELIFSRSGGESQSDLVYFCEDIYRCPSGEFIRKFECGAGGPFRSVSMDGNMFSYGEGIEGITKNEARDIVLENDYLRGENIFDSINW